MRKQKSREIMEMLLLSPFPKSWLFPWVHLMLTAQLKNNNFPMIPSLVHPKISISYFRISSTNSCEHSAPTLSSFLITANCHCLSLISMISSAICQLSPTTGSSCSPTYVTYLKWSHLCWGLIFLRAPSTLIRMIWLWLGGCYRTISIILWIKLI